MVHHRLDQYDPYRVRDAAAIPRSIVAVGASSTSERWEHTPHHHHCLLYTSDAADDMQCVDLGGRRIIKKKKRA